MLLAYRLELLVLLQIQERSVLGTDCITITDVSIVASKGLQSRSQPSH